MLEGKCHRSFLQSHDHQAIFDIGGNDVLASGQLAQQVAIQPVDRLFVGVLHQHVVEQGVGAT